jgi:hypothetical protein
MPAPVLCVSVLSPFSAPLYVIHDNGGRVQTVFDFPVQGSVAGGHVDIVSGEVLHYDESAALRMQYQRLWVGNDPASGVEGRGNTVLLQLTADVYYLIYGRHSRVFRLPANDPVLEYHSRIGNNDVPYPVALTARRTLLLLMDGWRVREGMTAEEVANPYTAFNDAAQAQHAHAAPAAAAAVATTWNTFWKGELCSEDGASSSK